MVKATVGAVVALTAVVAIMFAAAAGVVFGVGGGGGTAPAAMGAAPGAAEVPPAMWALYAEAAFRFGLQPALVAAVGKVECDHARNPACATPNAAGAVGPMQFLPTTFERYAWASGSPTPSPLHPRDAVHAAAAKLAADGAATDPWSALRSYNPSDAYAATVLAWALAYGWTPPGGAVLAAAVLVHPRLHLRPAAAADVRAGVVDERVQAVLLVVATRHELGGIGPAVTGHGYYVRGTRHPSNHAFGRAVDIFAVDGEPVSAANRSARAVVSLLLALTPALRPDEIGCPWLDLDALPGVFSDADHRGHLHVGFEG